MSQKVNIFLNILVIAIFFVSCVPVRKFEDLQKSEDACRKERDQLRVSAKDNETSNIELTSKVSELEKAIVLLANDTARLGLSLSRMIKQYDKINELNDQLLNKQKELVSGNASETKKILQELLDTRKDLQLKEDELAQLERDLNAKKVNLESLQSEVDIQNALIDAKNKDLEARNRKLLEMQRLINAKDSIVKSLKDRVSKALVGFEGNGLSVVQKNGKVYVSMDNKLLFKSGSFSLDQKGKDAIKELAKVLGENKDINIMVEGHTDTDAYNGTGQIKDNWDLSAMRSTVVVRTLLEGSSIDPIRITAAGRGEHMPLDAADTKEAKSINRRTEIILEPKMDELFQILNTSPE